MAELEDSFVLNINNKDDCTEIKFRQPIIFEYQLIYKGLTSLPDFNTLQDLKFEQLMKTVGGYDSGFGFQHTLDGLSNREAGKRIFVKDNFPSSVKGDEMIAEMRFSFAEKNKGIRQRKFRMRFVYDFVEIRPSPSPLMLREILEHLKRAIFGNEAIFLSSAKEKIKSAKSNFLRGYYREAMHNIYYALLSATPVSYTHLTLPTKRIV